MENEKKMASAGKKRRTRLGGYNVLISLVLVVIVVIVNLVVNALPSIYTKFDTSSEGYFTISEETEEIVAAIDEDVTIYYLEGNSSSTYADWTLDLLDRYKALNSHIKVETVDPVLSPNFYASYTDTAPSQHSFIAVSEKRSKVIDFSEIYVQEYTPNYTTMSYDETVSFAGEAAITSALDYVTSDDLPSVYTIEGNGEGTLPETLLTSFASDNVSVNSLSLLSGDGGIPEGTDCVIIYAPTLDLTADEITYLDSYMQSGGKIILVSQYSYDLPNLYAFTASHGLSYGDGVIVDTERCWQSPYYLLPNVISGELTSMLSSTAINVLMPNSHAIIADEANETHTVESVLTTSDSAVLKADPENATTYEAEEGDSSGSFIIGARSVNSETGGELVWYSSPYVAQETANNIEYFISVVETMCEKETSVTIAAKTLMTDVLTVPEFSANLWMSIMCIIIPLGLVVAGLFVWNSRRTR